MEEEKSFLGKVWEGIKKVYGFLDAKKVTIGFVLVNASTLIEDPTTKTILQIAGVVIGGEGMIDNLKKGRYKNVSK